MATKTKDSTGRTPITGFRFDEETLAKIDRVAAFLGLSGRAETLRFLVVQAEKNFLEFPSRVLTR